MGIKRAGRMTIETSQEEKETNTKELLLSYLMRSEKIYTCLRHTSRSGMLRRISLFVCVDSELVDLDYYIDKLGIRKRDKKNEGLRCVGCGMDIGFALVNSCFQCLNPSYDWQKEHRQEWI